MNDETRPDQLAPVRHFLSGHRLAHRESDGVISVAVPLDGPAGGEPELGVEQLVTTMAETMS